MTFFESNCFRLCLIVSICNSAISEPFKNLATSLHRETQCQDILKTVKNLFSIQHSQDCRRVLDHARRHVAIVYTNQTWHCAVKFQEIISSLSSTYYYLHLDLYLNAKASFPDIEAASKTFEAHSYKSSVHTVVILSQDCNWVPKFIQAICSNNNYKWTYLLHLTEWIIVSVNSNITIDLDFSDRPMCINFMTYLATSETGTGDVIISRKSRGYGFKFNQRKENQLENVWSQEELLHSFPDLTIKRKSCLQGLHIPVAFLPQVQRRSFEVTKKNKTRNDGFSIATIDVLASVLGFTYTLVPVTDGGLYGFVSDNGTAVGLVGLLARREAGLCAIGMNKIENRLNAIDFLDLPIEADPFVVLYALPDVTDPLDTTLADIVTPEYSLLLLGPCLIICLIGALVHIATKSCKMRAPVFLRKGQLWRIASFSDHIFFQKGSEYVGQTGRVLRASWALFFVILCAAYSAYLVTTFTVKPVELKLDGFETLLTHSNYRFGLDCNVTSLKTLFKTAKRGTSLNQMWTQLVHFNKTDPWTFGCNLTEHVVKVVEGGYAFFPAYETEGVLEELKARMDVSHVRNYPISHSYGLGGNYLALPYDAFYKDELNRAMLHLEETGVFYYLRRKYGIDKLKSVEVTPIESSKPVPLSRIMLLNFVTLGGVVIGTICLIVELLVARIFK